MNRDSESGGAPADQHVLCRREIARLNDALERAIFRETACAHNSPPDDHRAEITRLQVALASVLALWDDGPDPGDVARDVLDPARALLGGTAAPHMLCWWGTR